MQSGRLSTAAMLASAALCLAAGFGIYELLRGDNPHQLAPQALGTVAALIFFGLTAAAGVLLTGRRRGPWSWFGLLTVLMAALGFVAVSWVTWEAEILFYSVGSDLPGLGILFALGCGGASILLAWWREPGPGQWLGYAGAALLAALTILGALATIFNDFDPSAQLVGTIGFLFLLTAAVMAVLALAELKLGRPRRIGAALELDRVALPVSDRDAATRFYTALLGAEVVHLPEGRIAFQVGERRLDVRDVGAGEPGTPGTAELSFVWPAPAEAAVALVRELGQEPVAGPIERPGGRGAGRSVYLRDPDGSLIELISYRP